MTLLLIFGEYKINFAEWKKHFLAG